jgi:hypothetical protein
MNTLRPYASDLTIDINSKGVLDVDTVKGCTFGIAAHGAKGCYQGCYAAAIAKFRGIDFSRAVVRKVKKYAQAKQIEKRVKAAPLGFFRVGTMGDPCHSWDETVETVSWLAPFATPVIITKHWQKASDEHLKALAKVGAIINTSVSALDSEKHLARREKQIARYSELGGQSVARVVSCDFNQESKEGAVMAETQKRLFKHNHVIDNPLRISANHELVTGGVVKVRKVQDLIAIRTISMPEDSKTYVGHCNSCTELCGKGLDGVLVKTPKPKQADFFGIGARDGM